MFGLHTSFMALLKEEGENKGEIKKKILNQRNIGCIFNYTVPLTIILKWFNYSVVASSRYWENELS